MFEEYEEEIGEEEEELIEWLLKRPRIYVPSKEEQRERNMLLRKRWKEFVEEQKRLARDPKVQSIVAQGLELQSIIEELDEHMDEEYLSVGKVAKIFKVSTEAIRKWIEKGKLRAIRTVGGHRRIPKNEVIRLLKKLNEDLVF